MQPRLCGKPASSRALRQPIRSQSEPCVIDSYRRMEFSKKLIIFTTLFITSIITILSIVIVIIFAVTILTIVIIVIITIMIFNDKKMSL